MVKVKSTGQRNDSLLGGAFALTLSVIIVKIIGFLYKLPLSHIMGDEGMGYFNSAYSIFSFFYMLCTSGVPRAVSIIIAQTDAKGKCGAKRILDVCLKLYVSIGVLFSVILLIFSETFATLIGNSLSAFSLLSIAPSLAFVSASGVLRGYLNSQKRMRDIAISEIIEGAIKFVCGLTLALFAARKNMPTHMISSFTVLGVTLGTFIGAVFLFVCSKTENADKNTWQKCDLNNFHIIKNVFCISLPITFSSAIMGVSNIIDLGLVMKRLISFGMTQLEAVALFGNFTTLAVPMLNLVIALISPLGTSAIPHLTSEFTAGKKEKFENICQVIITVCSIIAFPLAFAYLFFSKEILLLLFNDDSAIIGAPLLSVLSVSVISMSLLTVLNSILEATLNPKIPLFSMTLGAFFKVICGYFFIGRLGIIGAPISTGISYGISLLISLGYVLGGLKLKISAFRLVWIPLFSSIISIGAAYVAYNYFFGITFNALYFLIFALIAAFLYFLFVCIFMRKHIRLIFEFVKSAKK